MSKWIPMLIVIAAAGAIYWWYRKGARAALEGKANTTGAPVGATSAGTLAALTAGSTQQASSAPPALPPLNVQVNTVTQRAAAAAAGNITIYTDGSVSQADIEASAGIKQRAAVKVLADPAKVAKLAAEIGKPCHSGKHKGTLQLNSVGTATFCKTDLLTPLPAVSPTPGNIVNPNGAVA